MRNAFAALMLLLVCGSYSLAQTTITTVTITSAQADAEEMARTGVLRHCGRNGGRREGIGFSPVSAQKAIESCCFFNQYRPREIGVARGRRGWYACIRY